MKKERAQWFGLLGPVSLISYTVAVVFSPLAYPGYNWLSQAVSDLSAMRLHGCCGINWLAFIW